MRRMWLCTAMGICLGMALPSVRAAETRYFYGTITDVQQASHRFSFTYVDEGTGEERRETVQVTPETEWASSGQWEDVHVGRTVYLETPVTNADLVATYVELITATPVEDEEP